MCDDNVRLGGHGMKADEAFAIASKAADEMLGAMHKQGNAPDELLAMLGLLRSNNDTYTVVQRTKILTQVSKCTSAMLCLDTRVEALVYQDLLQDILTDLLEISGKGGDAGDVARKMSLTILERQSGLVHKLEVPLVKTDA